jgi:hypothetical protein
MKIFNLKFIYFALNPKRGLNDNLRILFKGTRSSLGTKPPYTFFLVGVQGIHWLQQKVFWVPLQGALKLFIDLSVIDWKLSP